MKKLKIVSTLNKTQNNFSQEIKKQLKYITLKVYIIFKELIIMENAHVM